MYRSVIFLVVILSGCASVEPAAGDAEEVAAIFFRRIDPAGELDVIFTETVPAQWREVIAGSREISQPASEDERRYLPQGVIRIDRFALSGSRAIVKGWRGPVPRPVPGWLIDGCGTGYEIELSKTGGTWHTVAAREIEC